MKLESQHLHKYININCNRWGIWTLHVHSISLTIIFGDISICSVFCSLWFHPSRPHFLSIAERLCDVDVSLGTTGRLERLHLRLFTHHSCHHTKHHHKTPQHDRSYLMCLCNSSSNWSNCGIVGWSILQTQVKYSHFNSMTCLAL